MLHFLNERGPQGGDCDTPICLATFIIGQVVRPQAKDVSPWALLSKAESLPLSTRTHSRGQAEGTFSLPSGPTVLKYRAVTFY